MASKESTQRRSARVAVSSRLCANGRPRLSVHRSSKHIYVQVIDDSRGHTLAAASTLEKDLKARSRQVRTPPPPRPWQAVAERALQAGVKEVVFDRGPYIYHGRVKALADAAREAGLSF